jgi:hypothetical protein
MLNKVYLNKIDDKPSNMGKRMVFWETSTHDVRKNSIEDDFAFDFGSDLSESDHRFDL